MSENYELDDTCHDCNEGRCKFTIEKLEGHSKKHRIGICNKCGVKSLVGDCQGC